MDEDFFENFDEDVKPEILLDAGDAPDPMARLDQEKADASRLQAEQLLRDMRNDRGNESFEPSNKRSRMEIKNELTGQAREAARIRVHTIKTDNENCTHEVALPPDVPFQPLEERNSDPAKLYPFQLDAFQKEAILCIENNQSVLVSAHTSAGKTVVATYAIAQCLRDKQRVIYTSPIKALSNQKYRELEEEFGDVGLMTGDVTINPDGSCLVMTTEILRSMLYRGTEIMKEVGWVIFDEIHYMRDKERGVVWEETIILMPRNIKHAFLSATIPNARQFAQWVCHLHTQPCHVVYTDYRPTPLQHFIFPVGGSGIYEVVNVKGEFREDKFKEAMSGLDKAGDSAGDFNKRKGGSGGVDINVSRLIRTIKEGDMMPCIVFSFSRKECEVYATSLKDMDFNQPNEKQMVLEVYKSAIENLSEEDRQLPQIGNLLPLLQRGIGVHHSGLLPILKETIEILFGEGLLKVLFATETFSMGLNMPARTVLFTSASKFDGVSRRLITSGEYIQMSGRAGRRGKDDRGLVILMVDAQLSADDAKHIIKGATDPLNSQFRLTYNMVLNLMRVDGLNPSTILEKSFYQFQNESKLPVLEDSIKLSEKSLADFHIPGETELASYMELLKELEATKQAIRAVQRKPRYIVPFLHSGRLIKVLSGKKDFGWGPLVNFKKKVNPDDASEVIYVIEVMVRVISDATTDNPSTLVPAGTSSAKAEWVVVPMSLDCVDGVSSIRVKLPEDLTTTDGLLRLERIMKEVMQRMNNKIPVLHPVNDMKIEDKAVLGAIKSVESLEKRQKEHRLTDSSEFEGLKRKYEQKARMKEDLENLEEEYKKATSILHANELSNRTRVLRRLEYSNTEGLEPKGSVACELSASDELLLTEMLYAGIFNGITEAQVAALLSCFVFQDRVSKLVVPPELETLFRSLHEHARRIAQISNECRVEVIEDVYVKSFNPGLMDVVFKWIEGASFSDIVKETEVFEGSIIRTLRRLEEVLREMVSAAKSMANKMLEEKFESTRTKLKRDIVFAASLYL